MKFLTFCMIGLMPIGSWAQTTSPGKYCVKWMITSSSRFNFHKPRTDCMSGFGLCLRLGQLEIKAVPCDDEPSSNDLIDEDKIRFHAEWDGSRLLFRFPEQLMRLDNLKTQDLRLFSILEDELRIMNGNSDEVVSLRAGDYPVQRIRGEFVVSVDAALAGKIH